MLNLEESFSYCERLAKSHYENFPVGSFLLPKEKRKYIWSIYAFARTADDFADEGRSSQESEIDLKKRLNQLDDWEQKLNECANGKAGHPLFAALGESIAKLDIPVQLCRDLLTAYRMDVTKKRYQNFDEVLNYCRHSANPVGRLVLCVFGHRDESLNRFSDKICTALQLTNFWQDIEIDFLKDRIYIPQDDMKRFGVTEENLRSKTLSPQFVELIKFCVQKTAVLFNEGLPLCSNVGRNLRWEMRLTWLGGTSILKKIEQNGYDVFRKRPVIGAMDKVSLLLRSFFPSALQPIP